MTTLVEMVWKFNPYHDEAGRFASAPGGGKLARSFGKKFSSMEEADEWAKGAWQDWYGTLTTENKTSLREYKNNTTAFTLNRSLRQGKQGDVYFGADFRPRSMDALTASIDSALASAKAPEDLTLYRGAELPDSLKAGDLLHDKGFVSTSLRRNVANRFVPFRSRVVEIRVKRGQPAASLEQFTFLNPESEVLLPRNSKFRVIYADDKKVIVEYLGV